MESSTSHFALDQPITFMPPSGEPLTAHAEEVVFEREGGTLAEVRLVLRLDPEAYNRVDRESLFHLDPASRGPAAGGFTADSEVQVEARLDTGLLPGVAVLGEDLLEAGPAFGRLASGSPLLETESWYALSVTKELLRDADGGSLREGYSTLHAEDQSKSLRLDMLTIAEGVFEEQGFDWQETSDAEVIRADATGDNGAWTVYVVARETDGRCTVYSQAPWETPEPQRPAMSELLTRINFGLPAGNFELDFSDGEVRFKTTILGEIGDLTVSLFEHLLESNLAAMDAYFPALEAVRDNRLSPQAAVELVEG